ncbi:crotonase/enoyl-CoA hydratase family protein [Mobilicoccus caccae]|uniref:Enoyl-CoA hydratase n=1 Tax=Mobilicoccus caccae TaxID=1859295 RepID=A0ABQ6IM65_9MICO|nr:crotonase/enoyl-CoA hydratase family protein [Mobilicoccus caccae]GMA38293.1 enoyl-CoA hydratase [Mobilicoccus caccae]
MSAQSENGNEAENTAGVGESIDGGGTDASPAVLIERDGHVETWTLNRPDIRNAISDDDMIDAIVEAVGRVNVDDEVRAVVLTGAGSAFSAGGNVRAMAEKSGMFGGSPARMREGYRRGIQRIPRALYECEVPVVAAVNGPAVGAGCDLALMCDLRIASATAFFAESFVKLGIIPGDGGAWFLPRVVGAARAAEMALTGDAIDAATALEWGLVSRVVEPDDLLTAAHELAARIAANPPRATRMTKRLLRESAHSSLSSLLELSAAMQPLGHHTADHAEALAAMREKRTGTYTGD